MIKLGTGAGPVKGYRHGTDRLVSPAQTLARVRPLLAGMGITRLANVTGLDVVDVPVVMAIRPNSRSLSVSQGKGLTLDAAMASAAMESIESYHAERVGLPLLLGSYAELRRGHRLARVDQLPTTAGVDFPQHRPLLWVQGDDLISGEPTWVPFDLVHTDMRVGTRPVASVFTVTSSGLASGNHLLEAVSHAVCEVIERDATTLWPLRPPAERAARRLDLDSVDDPGCRSVLDRFAAAGLRVAAWDTTTDIGLPCFASEIAEDPNHSFVPMSAGGGYGCHPRREIALLRALTEAAQSRLTLIAGSRDDMFRPHYRRNTRPVDAQILEPDAAAGGRDMAQIPTFRHDAFEADVELAVARLQTAGICEVIAVDLTQPEIGLPVVRVVVPGLEPIHHGRHYQPGVRGRAMMAGAS